MMKLRGALASLLVLCSTEAFAHPHSFIDMDVSFEMREQKLTGLKMVWVMDEMTSADLLYDAENGKDDPEVWKKLAAEVMANVTGQHYFTYVYRDGKPIKYKSLPSDYQLYRQGYKAVLAFVLPLTEPQDLAGRTFEVSTYDPTYFVDMRYKNKDSIHLPPEIAARCECELVTPTPSELLKAYALSLDKSDMPDEDMQLGQEFAQRVRLKCQ
ncbi:DUF1007 family protein [Serratia microhaemolytica]|uniref:DUF1007 family protein n=1 Tax=Serratia microhaemolytica TaxID=2675110 RepID=UPI000FDE794F|nr:DUF1007 family protein [Serratia microhaemolytica]